jgi:hypothetical protein
MRYLVTLLLLFITCNLYVFYVFRNENWWSNGAMEFSVLHLYIHAYACLYVHIHVNMYIHTLESLYDVHEVASLTHYKFWNPHLQISWIWFFMWRICYPLCENIWIPVGWNCLLLLSSRDLSSCQYMSGCLPETYFSKWLKVWSRAWRWWRGHYRCLQFLLWFWMILMNAQW